MLLVFLAVTAACLFVAWKNNWDVSATVTAIGAGIVSAVQWFTGFFG